MFQLPQLLRLFLLLLATLQVEQPSIFAQLVELPLVLGSEAPQRPKIFKTSNSNLPFFCNFEDSKYINMCVCTYV